MHNRSFEKRERKEKRHVLLAALMAMACLNVSAQTGKEWDDPLITSVNRETAHTIAIPVAAEADIAQNDMTLSPWFQSLNGQ